jgi:hypothetical protein
LFSARSLRINGRQARAVSPPTNWRRHFLRSILPSTTPRLQERTCLKNVAPTNASVSCRRPGMAMQKASTAGEASTRPGMEHME